jgi:hypothetical protein
MHPPPGAAATRALRRFDELEAVCRDLLPCGEVMMWLSTSSDLAPRGRTRDPGASTEIESSRGLHGLFSDGSLTPMSPTSCAIHLGGRSSTRPNRPEPLRFGDDRPPLSILSVGYTCTDNGYPPSAPARQRKRRAIASGSQPGTPGLCGVRSEPYRSVAATDEPHRPCQTGDSRYHRNAERAEGFRIAIRFALGKTPRNPRRASPAPATPYEKSPKKPTPA